MRILGIETSCDETSLSIIDATGNVKNPRFVVRSYSLLSQVSIHQKYGGVFPNLAQREHQKNLVPMLAKTLEEAGLSKPAKDAFKPATARKLIETLERETELLARFLAYVPTIARPDIDAIAVTYGPGLEPALWVGVNFAKALGVIWNIPVVPTNHMEGHLASVLLGEREGLPAKPAHAGQAGETIPVKFPLIALLVSGGHTELIFSKQWGTYEVIGETLDDAAGEAFDKVARMLGLPYPGGPQISQLAEAHRNAFEVSEEYKLPRPMKHSGNLDFSFAGLKTAVLYKLKKLKVLNANARQTMAREFEDAVVDVLISKTKKALETYAPKTLIAGGGVIANTALRREFEVLAKEQGVELRIPQMRLATDNALMIAMAGFIKIKNSPDILKKKVTVKAFGNLRLS